MTKYRTEFRVLTIRMSGNGNYPKFYIRREFPRIIEREYWPFCDVDMKRMQNFIDKHNNHIYTDLENSRISLTFPKVRK